MGSNTFAEFKCDTPPHSILFDGGETQTITTWTVSGSAGNLITIDGIENGKAVAASHVHSGGADWAVDDWFYIESTGTGDSFWGIVTGETAGTVTSYDVSIAGTNFSIADEYVALAEGMGSGSALTIDITGVTASNIEHNLSMAAGIASSDYLDLSNSNAGGGADWYAGANSEDTANNDGWIFTAPPGGTVLVDMIGCGVIPFGR
jgi:hypothetical protein